MKLTAIFLRLSDIFKSFGLPPYSYVDFTPGGPRVVCSYSLQRVLTTMDPDPSTTVPGSKACSFHVMVGEIQYTFRQDRFGRKHLPLELRRRML